MGLIDREALKNYIDEMPEVSVEEIRAKAINEFVNALLNYQSQDEDYKSLSDVCYEIAKQLKGEN